MPFNTVNFSDEAYSIIDSTASRINETFVQKTQVNGFDIISLEEALKVDNEFLNLAYKPNKKTILHRFMKEYLDMCDIELCPICHGQLMMCIISNRGCNLDYWILKKKDKLENV